MKLLIIIRGLPGSGKSTLAHKLSKHVFEADQYFTSVVDGAEQYKFVPDQVPAAHGHCFDQTRIALEAGYSPVVVSNTFSQYWEYSDYLELAADQGYTVQILTAVGPWENIHGCPVETIEKMRRRWQPSFLSQQEYDAWLFQRTKELPNTQYTRTNAPS